MNRTTVADLKRSVRRLNFALGIVEKSSGEYIVARVPRGWQLQRDYHSGPVAITSGSRRAGEVYRHIEAMLDGIAAARGHAVPRTLYDRWIKSAQPAPAAAARVTERGLETSDGQQVCEFCNLVSPGSIASMGEDSVYYCDNCRRADAASADCCPVTGEEYGTGA